MGPDIFLSGGSFPLTVGAPASGGEGTCAFCQCSGSAEILIPLGWILGPRGPAKETGV